MTEAILLFGSNVQPLESLTATQQQLSGCKDIHITERSAVYESPTVLASGETDSSRPMFLNVAFLVETRLDRPNIQTATRRIESLLGRKRTEDKYADRTVDLDILALRDGDKIEEPDQNVWSHAFAALPAADVAPDWIIASRDLTISQIAAQLKPTNTQIRRI